MSRREPGICVTRSKVLGFLQTKVLQPNIYVIIKLLAAYATEIPRRSIERSINTNLVQLLGLKVE